MAQECMPFLRGSKACSEVCGGITCTAVLHDFVRTTAIPKDLAQAMAKLEIEAYVNNIRDKQAVVVKYNAPMM
eukprot:549719-Pelagomonas_calceolata.AAC.1